MDLEPSDDQVALRDAVRRLCEGRFPIEAVSALADRPAAVDPSRWRALADTGVFSLRVAEADGGAGLGLADAAIVFEELGRALVPGPVLATHLAVTYRLDGGAAVVGLVESNTDSWLVEHLDALDTLLVVDTDGVWRVASDELDAVAVAEPLDPLTPLHRVASLHRAEQAAGHDVAVRLCRDGAVLAAAFAVGIAAATTDLAVVYAKERHQFDRPIGSFQAVKHLLADMLVRTEVARAAVYAAAVTVDQPDAGDVARAVAAAKLTAGEAALANGKACIQVHGGMGFTWEVSAHLYLKRAWWLDTVFGSTDDHAEIVAAALG